MYRSLIIRCFQLRQLRKECLVQSYEVWRNTIRDSQWTRHLSTTHVYWKKRKSVEERAVENTGRRVIRYSPKAGTEVVGIWRNMTVKELADVLKRDVDHIYKALEFADKTADTDYRSDTVLREQQVIRDVVKICGCRFKLVPRPQDLEDEEEGRDATPAGPAPEAELRPRPPVVCVMGHVDHGKTTLLDALRGSSQVDHEFGGITQHIGAFQVPVGSSRVTFLDTPGHAAFSAMRARGAAGADLVVLLVAADDGVMDQTRQSASMAAHAEVPILVAINKIDKPGVNIERVLNELASIGIVCEQLGGEVQAVPVSALKKTGLRELLEALVAQAQLMELRATPGGAVEGVVLEARLHPALGKQAAVLVRRGSLRRGAVLLAGRAWGKVRLLTSAEGEILDEVPPSYAALVSGWRELPRPGDLLLEVPSEKRAHEVMKYRQAQHMKQKQEEDQPAIESKEAAHRQQYEEKLREKRARGRWRTPPEPVPVDEGPRDPTLTVIVKGDAEGSVEALVELLHTYHDPRVRLTLAHAAVGPLTHNDLETAKTFNAVIYLFNVGADEALLTSARAAGLTVSQHQVLYRLAEDVRRRLADRMPEREEEEILGEAHVLQQFFVSDGNKKVPVAGARCVKGTLLSSATYRLERGGEVLYEGKLASMKHLKDEVPSIKRDQECGLRLRDPGVALAPGDRLVCLRQRLVRDPPDWDPGF